MSFISCRHLYSHLSKHMLGRFDYSDPPTQQEQMLKRSLFATPLQISLQSLPEHSTLLHKFWPSRAPMTLNELSTTISGLKEPDSQTSEHIRTFQKFSENLHLVLFIPPVSCRRVFNVNLEVSDAACMFYDASVDGERWHCLPLLCCRGCTTGLTPCLDWFRILSLGTTVTLVRRFLDGSDFCAGVADCFVDIPVVCMRRHPG